MLKVTVLALFVLSCNCVEVLEVSGNRIAKSQETHLPIRSVSGISSISGLSAGLPVSSSYVAGVSPVSSINAGYLSDLRQRVLGVNVAPSALSYLPFQSSLLGIRQNQYAVAHQPAAISFAQPAISIAHQPAISIAHQPAVAIQHVARPQVLAVQQQVQQQVHPVNAAIQQVARTVEYRPVPYNDQPIVPQEVVVEPSDQPINIHFRSRSSTVRLSQEHIPGEPGSIEQTQSQDEPSKVVHEVVKPVVQEVREVIQPYRQVTQEIQPVVENVHTVTHQGEGQRAQYVAEPIARQQYVAVRPAVQQYAVAQPVVQAVRSVAVAQPAIQAIRQVAIAQPQYQTVAVPQVQTLAVPQIRYAQPQVVSRVVAQPQVVSQVVAQPLSYGVQSVGIAQPVVGVSRVIANQGALLREARPVVTGQRGNDYVKYVESNQK